MEASEGEQAIRHAEESPSCLARDPRGFLFHSYLAQVPVNLRSLYQAATIPYPIQSIADMCRRSRWFRSTKKARSPEHCRARPPITLTSAGDFISPILEVQPGPSMRGKPLQSSLGLQSFFRPRASFPQARPSQPYFRGESESSGSHLHSPSTFLFPLATPPNTP